MNTNFSFRCLAMAVFFGIVCIAANAETALAPYGQFSNKSWTAKYFYSLVSDGNIPAEDWYAPDFDDSSWGTILGPISLTEQWSSYPALSFIGTAWEANNSSYWVRRYFTVDDLLHDSYVFYVIHDDACKAYLNGVKIYENTGAITFPNYNTVAVSKNVIKEGNNVLSVFVSDTGGGQALLDFGLYAHELNEIVAESDVQLSFTNDEVNPWIVNDKTAVNGNQGKNYSSSWFSFSFSSDYSSELKFDWYKYRYYSGGLDLKLFIDGVLKSSTTNSSWTTQRYYLEPGNHVIAFCDTIGSDSYRENSGIRNLSLKNLMPLESAVLSENSQPLTFMNNAVWPWTIENGYIQSSNYGTANSSSSFSTTFTIDKVSKFSFNRRVGYWNGSNYTSDYSSYHSFRFRINGELYYGNSYITSFGTIRLALDPGTYTMEWSDTIYNTTSYLLSQVKDIELSSNWVEVELASAGSLGVEVLYQVDVLADVEMLKVRGPLNNTDWTNIKQMKNLTCLDLSEANLESIPDRAFEGLNFLSKVMLPQGLKDIGQFAFYGTQIGEITLPETLASIGNAAFANCKWLKQVDIPHSVTSVGYCAFQGCTAMKAIHFSNGMTTILDNVCNGCNSLTNVTLPNNLQSIGYYSFAYTTCLRQIQLPGSLNYIHNGAFYKCGLDSVVLPVRLQYLESGAFSECSNLKYVELPSYLVNSSSYYRYYYLEDRNINSYSSSFYTGYRNNFSYCPLIEKVVCQSATPPIINNDPFSNGRAKNEITLVVPSFAVVNYKLDTYWYQFGSIIEGDDIDYWAISSTLSLTNNRRMNGKPDIDLCEGGQLTVGGNAPMEVGLFNMFNSEQNPCRLLNMCEAMTADSINTSFSVNANTWYFFTPLHDVEMSKISVSNDASYVFRYYDGSSRASNGTGSSWRNVDNNKLMAGQGYIFHCNTNAVITMPASAATHGQVFRTSDYTKPLTTFEATTSANKSWNYVGNPYPCYYDIYYMDFTAPITVWTGSTYKAYSIVDDNLVLRPMQSFFVQKPDAVDNIVFRKEGRQLTTEITHGAFARAFYAPSQNNRYLFNLKMQGAGMMDETRIVVNDKASLDYEIECDASKFMSFESAVPQIFTLDSHGNSYAINERPMDNGIVKLAYYAGQAGTYTISANRSDGIIYLFDAESNKTINLIEQDYTFYSNATEGTNTTRFVLTLNPGGETDIREIEKEQDNSIIYDLQGRKVQNVSKGIYIQNGQKVIRQ